jgi:hypothetical protein
MAFLVWGIFFFCKNYGHLRVSQTPVDLGYNVINKTKRVRGRRKNEFQKGYFKVALLGWPSWG